MKIKTLAMGAATAMLLAAAPSIAEAAWAKVTPNTSVNMRSGPDTSFNRVATVPHSATVWIDGQENGWFHVTYAGRSGYISSTLIDTRTAMARPDRGPQMYGRGIPPRFGYYKKPYWDNQRQAWYDGRRWYRNGVWYNSPSGLSFGFSFGG